MQLTYDTLDQVKTVTDPLNRVTAYNYDRNEDLTSMVDANGKTTAYQYDERGLLFKITDANTPAGVTQYDYDPNGNLAKLTDAKGNATVITNDLFDRESRKTYADNTYEEYTYDKNSNALTRRMVFKWLNRRSQKPSMNWAGFMKYLEKYPLPRPRIVHQFYVPYKLCKSVC